MRASRWLWLGLLLAAGAFAAAAAEEEPPTLELLEFLGSFETAGGEWIDPTQLEVPMPDAKGADTGGHEK